MRFLLCCSDLSSQRSNIVKIESKDQINRVIFNQSFDEYQSDYTTINNKQCLPPIIDSIIRHLLSSCQLERRIFIDYPPKIEYEDLKKNLKNGIKDFDPNRYDPYILAAILMEYVKSVKGGIFTPGGEECLAELSEITSKRRQAEVFKQIIRSIHPLNAQLIVKIFYLFYSISQNYFINQVNIPDLCQAIIPYFFINHSRSFFVKLFHSPRWILINNNLEKLKSSMQLLFTNRHISNLLTYDRIIFWHPQTIEIQEKYIESDPGVDEINETSSNQCDLLYKTTTGSYSHNGSLNNLNSIIRSSHLMNYWTFEDEQRQSMDMSRSFLMPSFQNIPNMPSRSLYHDFIIGLRQSIIINMDQSIENYGEDAKEDNIIGEWSKTFEPNISMTNGFQSYNHNNFKFDCNSYANSQKNLDLSMESHNSASRRELDEFTTNLGSNGHEKNIDLI